jgi:hypothetical protein
MAFTNGALTKQYTNQSNKYMIIINPLNTVWLMCQVPILGWCDSHHSSALIFLVACKISVTIYH